MISRINFKDKINYIVNKNTFYAALLTFCILIGNNSAAQTIEDMVDKVHYVTKFPKTYHLKGKTKPNIKLIGMSHFKIHDSLLAIETRATGKLKFALKP